MAIDNFIPEIWTAKLMTALEKSLVYGGSDCVNRDYEGDIKQHGDTVHIPGLSDPTIGTYTKHTDITIEQLNDSKQTLVINQSKYFAFEVDDLEARQAAGDALTKQAQRAAYLLRDKADQYLASLMATGAASGNQISNQQLDSPEKAYDLLVDLSTLLEEANVPAESRFAVITPKLHGLLQKDKRFIAAGDSESATARINGHIGRAAGMAIKLSNNAPAGSAGGKMVIAGSSMATTYAEQIAKTEGFRMEKRFADGVKGLHLYGAKVLRPEALATAEVTI